MAAKKDPTEAIRLAASRYPGVDEGTSCTQASFKAGKKAFLYIGLQGGRHKAMFKLQDSMPEAIKLAKKEPDRFEVGSTAWVTTRFSADDPLPKKLWKKWLDESYALSAPAKASKKTTKKKAAGKKTTASRAGSKSKSKSKSKPKG